MKFEVPTEGNEKLEKIIRRLEDNGEIEGFLESANVNAVDRLKYSDHGPVHSKIVANAALRILRIFTSQGITPSIVEDHEMTEDDAEVVVVLSSILHDIGMAVNRKGHDRLGIGLAKSMLDDILSEIYDRKERAVITSEILGAIYNHNREEESLTVESGILKVADGLDMEEGRARISFEAGRENIHSVSAMAIDDVKIEEGEEKAVKIKINMSSSAGIFQVNELLKDKVLTSGLKDHFKIMAEINDSGEEKILEKFEI